MKEIIFVFDKFVLDVLIYLFGDVLVNLMIFGGGALTFLAGVELKRVIFVFVSVVKDFNVGMSIELIILKFRVVVDVCMILKDVLIDVKFCMDIVCGKFTDEEFVSVVLRFCFDDFVF